MFHDNTNKEESLGNLSSKEEVQLRATERAGGIRMHRQCRAVVRRDKYLDGNAHAHHFEELAEPRVLAGLRKRRHTRTKQTGARHAKIRRSRTPTSMDARGGIWTGIRLSA